MCLCVLCADRIAISYGEMVWIGADFCTNKLLLVVHTSETDGRVKERAREKMVLVR